jgi:hypothetical protein
MRAGGWFLLLMAAGCRWGGPSEGPPATAPDAAADVLASSDAAPLDLRDEEVDAGPAAVDSAAPAGRCQPPFSSAVCDPVCNSGCPALSRCDVSPAARTGACVGIWTGTDGELCFSGKTTDSCAPRLTCWQGRCARLCYADADCNAGTCCVRSLDLESGPSGFRLCGPCP